MTLVRVYVCNRMESLYDLKHKSHATNKTVVNEGQRRALSCSLPHQCFTGVDCVTNIMQYKKLSVIFLFAFYFS